MRSDSVSRPALPSKGSGRQVGGGRGAVSGSDAFNVAGIVGAAAAAHQAPYLTLLLAYAVLGPAHYLTEISWLRRRRYFVPDGGRVGACLVFLALVFVLAGTGPVGCAALAAALALSVAAALGVSTPLMAGVTLAVFALGLALGAAGARPIAIAAILVPTVVHVLAFTIGFVVRGARKTRTLGGYLVVSAIIAAVASFLLVPTAAEPRSEPARLVSAFFGPALAGLGGDHWPLSERGAAGLLAFGYAYHYLNWFSKTTVVGWHRQNGGQLALIGAACIAIGGAYLASFRLGFLLSLPLSVAHVFLEFPLNAATFGLSRRAPGMPVAAAPGAASPAP